MYKLPENLNRFISSYFVNGAALETNSRNELLHHAAMDVARGGAYKIFLNYVKSTEQYQGYQGQTLELDVYVLSPLELNKIISEAYIEGVRDGANRSC